MRNKSLVNCLRTAGNIPRWELFEKALLIAVALDLALGGNGYLIRIGGFRLREIFFALCMAWVVLRLTRIKPIRLDAKMLILSGAYVAITAFDAGLGYFNGSQFGAIVAELKPLSYFPMLLFFLVAIRTRDDVTLMAGLLTVCGTLLASLYLLLLLIAKTGLVSYPDILESLKMSDEFIFREVLAGKGVFVGFLYKGAFYVSVAALFLLFDPFKTTKILAAVAVVATAMTLTRGLCLALAVCILAGMVLERHWRRVPMLLGQCALLFAVLFLALQAEMRLSPGSGDRSNSSTTIEKRTGSEGSTNFRGMVRPTDSERTKDLEFVAKELNFSTVAIGRGLGAPIRSRERIELTYLEIFYKQGLLGLSFWLVLFLHMVQLYRAVPRETRAFALAYFLSGLFVFVATASNTFLTGSIGMAVVFISIASLLVLSREDPRPMPRWAWYAPWLNRVPRPAPR